TATTKRESRMSILAARIPGTFFPECLEQRVVSVKNIALCLAHIRDTNRESAARTQTAFAVAGVLPEVPLAPRRNAPRLRVIICDPEPAIGENRALRAAHAGKHLAQPIFAAVNSRIFPSPLFNSLTECDGLCGAHVDAV